LLDYTKRVNELTLRLSYVETAELFGSLIYNDFNLTTHHRCRLGTPFLSGYCKILSLKEMIDRRTLKNDSDRTMIFKTI